MASTCNTTIHGPFNTTQFLGATIVDFSIQLGYNSQSTRLDVNLVEDKCEVQKVVWTPDGISQIKTVKDAFNPPQLGAPVFFRIGSFVYGGILKNWEFVEDSSKGKMFKVNIEGPNQILSGTTLILDNYIGHTLNVPNIINVYGYLEDKYGSSCDQNITLPYEVAKGFGGADRNSAGINYKQVLGVLPKLVNIRDGKWSSGISLRGFQFQLDLSGMPRMDEYYRIQESSMSLLDFIEKVVKDAGGDYRLELTYPNIITVYVTYRKEQLAAALNVDTSVGTPIDLRLQLSKISNFIKNNQAENKSYGLELRDESTSAFLVGDFIRPFANVENNLKKVFDDKLAKKDIIKQDELKIQFFLGKNNDGSPIRMAYVPSKILIKDRDGKIVTTTSYLELVGQVDISHLNIYVLDINKLKRDIQRLKRNFSTWPQILRRINLRNYLNQKLTTWEFSTVELLAATESLDSWKSVIEMTHDLDIVFTLGFGTPPVDVDALRREIINALKDDNNALRPAGGSTNVMKFLKKDNNILDMATLFAINQTDSGIRLYNFIREIANNFGTRFMIDVGSICSKFDSESDTFISTNWIPVDSGWEENEILGKSVNSDIIKFFREKDGTISAFLRFDVNPIDVGIWDMDANNVIVDGNKIYVKCSVDEVVYLDNDKNKPRVVVSIDNKITHKKMGVMYNENDTREIAFDVISYYISLKYLSDDALPEEIRQHRDNLKQALLQLFKSVTGQNPPPFRYRYEILFPEMNDFLLNTGLNGWLPGMENIMSNFISRTPILPSAAAIPMQSTTITYGPWIAGNGVAMKTEFEQDSRFAPWNFGSVKMMNLAANITVANKVLSQIVNESGSITFPGLLNVNLGQALVAGGPEITSIDFGVSTGGFKTTIKMRTFTPSFGELAKQFTDNIQRISQSTNKYINKIIETTKKRRFFPSEDAIGEGTAKFSSLKRWVKRVYDAEKRAERFRIGRTAHDWVSAETKKITGIGGTTLIDTITKFTDTIRGASQSNDISVAGASLNTFIRPIYNCNIIKHSYGQLDYIHGPTGIIHLYPKQEYIAQFLRTTLPSFNKNGELNKLPNSASSGVYNVDTMHILNYKQLLSQLSGFYVIKKKKNIHTFDSIKISTIDNVSEDEIITNIALVGPIYMIGATEYNKNIPKAGPIDLRWDDYRKVWYAPCALNIGTINWSKISDYYNTSTMKTHANRFLQEAFQEMNENDIKEKLINKFSNVVDVDLESTHIPEHFPPFSTHFPKNLVVDTVSSVVFDGLRYQEISRYKKILFALITNRNTNPELPYSNQEKTTDAYIFHEELGYIQIPQNNIIVRNKLSDINSTPQIAISGHYDYAPVNILLDLEHSHTIIGQTQPALAPPYDHVHNIDSTLLDLNVSKELGLINQSGTATVLVNPKLYQIVGSTLFHVVDCISPNTDTVDGYSKLTNTVYIVDEIFTNEFSLIQQSP